MMNKSFLKIKVISIALLTCIFVVSCSDDDNADASSLDITQEDVTKSLEVDKISNYIDNITLDNVSTNRSNGKISSKLGRPGCADFSLNNTGYTLSFSDCTTEDGETINGAINVSIVIENNSVSTTITFDNLSYAGNSVNGSKSTSYSLDTDSGSFIYSVTSDLSLVLADGTIATAQGTKTYTITGTVITDAAYTLSGNWIVTLNTDSYSLATDPTLEGSLTCAYLTKGTLIMTKNDLNASINYGDGTCDNKATVTYPDGTMEEIEL